LKFAKTGGDEDMLLLLPGETRWCCSRAALFAIDVDGCWRDIDNDISSGETWAEFVDIVVT